MLKVAGVSVTVTLNDDSEITRTVVFEPARSQTVEFDDDRSDSAERVILISTDATTGVADPEKIKLITSGVQIWGFDSVVSNGHGVARVAVTRGALRSRGTPGMNLPSLGGS